MAPAAKKKQAAKPKAKSAKDGGKAAVRPLRRLTTWVIRAVLALVALIVGLVLLYTVVNPPYTQTMWSEKRRLGKIERQWVPLESISPVMARSVVAAEDADFCLHWGFDVNAIRAAIEAGGTRGGSTISQQVVKNVFLWQDRSWIRKALETMITPLVEIVWSKRRIVEVYLNVAETGEGVFGVEAAAQSYFGTSAAKLSANQAALIAAVLPSPRTRSAAKPSGAVKRRAGKIRDGAATIEADGRARCFQDG